MSLWAPHHDSRKERILLHLVTNPSSEDFVKINQYGCKVLVLRKQWIVAMSVKQRRYLSKLAYVVEG